MILTDFGGSNGGGGGLLDANILHETNRIFLNRRHDVWIRKAENVSNVVPVLRNDRIHANGTVPIPPDCYPPFGSPCYLAGGPAGDGVRIELGPGLTTGMLAPTLVHMTIVNQS
jgi:hypothetical protein